MSQEPTPGRTLELVRQSYREISLYAPNRAPCAIDLSDNTNLYGVPPTAEKTFREMALPAITRYPLLYAAELKAALSAYCGVDAKHIVTGCGSDDVLDSAVRAFAEPGDTLAYPEPSFAMMPLFAKMNALKGVGVRLKSDFDIDAEGMLATGAKIIYVCSPNNPTGTLASKAALEKVIANAPGVVILDEAYAEFCEQNYLADASRHGRLLVVRTLSKAFGLAGLRIGYAVGTEALVNEVEKSRGPYKVNGVAERTAVAALRHDLGWVKEKVQDSVRNRARLVEALKGLGLTALPSGANFVLVPVPKNAVELDKGMRQRGVAVRPFTHLPGIGEALRISLGPWEQVQAALDALKAVLA
ncbi:MAG TPA: histidinol-phosphate transaminase [Myxococcaceae bacterium]|nr:histidinol-phosphate transaminase [Myxococcaceae bacterium]